MLSHRKARAATPVVALLALGCALSGCQGSRAPSPVVTSGHATPTASSGPRTTASYTAGSGGSGAPSAEQMRITADRLRKRAAALGLKGAEVRVNGAVVTVVAPGRKDDELRRMAATAVVEFRPVLDPAAAGQYDLKSSYASLTCGPAGTATPGTPATPATPATSTRPERTAAPSRPERPTVACDPVLGAKYLLGPTSVTGADIDDATARFDSANRSGWVVDIAFTGTGTAAFAKATGALAQRTTPANQLAILIDGTVLSAPAVESALTEGKAEISGTLTQDAADNLAANVSSGALPVDLTVTDVTVRP